VKESGPEGGLGEAVCGGQYPAVIQQRSTTVITLITERNLVEQHATGNLSLKGHEPRPLAFSEAFSTNQALHDAMTTHASATVISRDIYLRQTDRLRQREGEISFDQNNTIKVAARLVRGCKIIEYRVSS